MILQYNAKGWLTNVADGATSNTIVNYQYNAAGYRTYRGLGNGAHTRYAYDAAGRLTSLTNYHSSGTAISGYNYGYDNAGNRKWVQRLGGLGDVYTYDAADQVTNVLYDATTPDGTPGMGTNRVGYAIDAAGNWTGRVQVYPTLGLTNTTTYIVSPLNQYTNVNGAKQWYDAKGNYYSDGTNSYYYDYRNRMYQSYFPGTGITYSNVYDVVGRWVGRKRSAVWNRYYYAGWQLIEERNNAGAMQAKYVYGAGLDEPVRMYRSSTYYYYLSDGLGNVTEVLDASGNIVEKYTYDIYGAPTIRSSAGTVLSATAIGNRWLFTGRDWDAEQQAYNYRYRWYSPSLGRFLQTDPIGVAGGLNLYAYVENKPVNGGDPLGLEKGEGVAALNRLSRRTKIPCQSSGSLLGKVWNLPNTVIGLLYGAVVAPFSDVSLGNNAIQFSNVRLQSGLGDITLGNVIFYSPTMGATVPTWYDQSHTYADHESQHTYQGEFLGPFYLPANILGMGYSLISSGSTYKNNFMESGPYSHPPKPW